MQRKTGLSDLWNFIHKEEKAMLEHTIRLHTCKTIYLNLSLVTCIFYVLSPCTVYIKLSNFESSKHCVKLLSPIFIIRCLTKYGSLQNFSIKAPVWSDCGHKVWLSHIHLSNCRLYQMFMDFHGIHYLELRIHSGHMHKFRYPLICMQRN